MDARSALGTEGDWEPLAKVGLLQTEDSRATGCRGKQARRASVWNLQMLLRVREAQATLALEESWQFSFRGTCHEEDPVLVGEGS